MSAAQRSMRAVMSAKCSAIVAAAESGSWALQRLQHLAVLAHDVLVVGARLGHVGLELPVDVPEQLDQLQHEDVAERLVEQFVEPAVVAGAPGVAVGGQRVQFGAQGVEVGRRQLPGGTADQPALQQRTDLDDVQQGAGVVPAHREPGVEEQSGRERAQRGAADVGAVPVPDVDDAERLEALEGLTHRIAADAERAHQLGLGGQRVTGVEVHPTIRSTIWSCTEGRRPRSGSAAAPGRGACAALAWRLRLPLR